MNRPASPVHADNNPESKTPPDATATSVQRSVDTTRADLPPDGKKQGEDGSVPLMPHERDQSVGMTDDHPDENVQQAFRDVQRGLQDTDRGPAADQAYKKQK